MESSVIPKYFMIMAEGVSSHFQQIWKKRDGLIMLGALEEQELNH
jgi:hypothetical protein